MPSESDIPIHTFSNFTKVSLFISSLDHQYQSIKHTIFAVLQHDGQTSDENKVIRIAKCDVFSSVLRINSLTWSIRVRII